VLALAKIGLPADDCYDAGSCSRFGDGDWSQGRELYVDINYGGVDPFPSAVTRYDYYLAEFEASSSGSGGLLGGLINDILPQCSNNTSSDPARRVVVAASIDCPNLTMSEWPFRRQSHRIRGTVPEVLSQFSSHDGMTDNFGHSYPASAANC
jgi:hypothetical protein